jgi:hypothetical protein
VIVALSGKGLCDELITPPEESCVVVCDLETSYMRKPWLIWGEGDAVAPKTKQTLQLTVSLLIVNNIRLNVSTLLTKITAVYGKNHTNNMNISVGKNIEFQKKKKGGGVTE